MRRFDSDVMLLLSGHWTREPANAGSLVDREPYGALTRTGEVAIVAHAAAPLAR